MTDEATTGAKARVEIAGPVGWVSSKLACEISGLYSAKIRELADKGLIRRRTIVGTHTRYSLADVMKLIEDAGKERGIG